MAQMVTDFLERETLSNQMGRTGMAQCMWSSVACANPKGQHAPIDYVVEVGSRAQGSLDCKKYLAPGAWGTDLLQIPPHRISHESDQWICLPPPLFGTPN